MDMVGGDDNRGYRQMVGLRADPRWSVFVFFGGSEWVRLVI